MKFEASQATRVLASLASYRLVLLHGDDQGLIRELAEAITRAVANSLDDPFRVVELDRGGWNSIGAEMSALSMSGGRRVVRVREAGDAVTDLAKAALKGAGEAMLILEAPGLGRGKLRTLVEGGKDLAAIACYPAQGAALQTSIRAILEQEGLTADRDAMAWLATSLEGDRFVLRSELEKIALYATPGTVVDLTLAQACVGDATAGSVDESLVAAIAGNVVAADTALERAISGGTNGVTILRLAQIFLQRLHLATIAVSRGSSAEEAVRALRPPAFFRVVGAMAAAAARLDEPSVRGMITAAVAAEVQCKQTGSRPDLLARRFAGQVARASGRATR